ncbi:hypothetical protein [Halosimplex halobium]|uniref:hypothetical protein n=1 Tax=Halosimplex halobium TaxID=3396618 RepID=UPI003F56A41C
MSDDETEEDSKQELLNIYDRQYSSNQHEGTVASHINLYFPFDGVTGHHFQFSRGAFNAVNLNGERKAAFQQIIDSEGLKFETEGPSWMTARDPDWSPGTAVRMTEKILEQVYDINLEDVTKIEAVNS